MVLATRCSIPFSGTLFNVFMTIIAAYPLSREDLVGRRVITIAFIFTMLFSGGLIPTYMVVRDLGLLNTRAAMILPTGIGIFNLLITITFFRTTIPPELIEAARIDGANDFRTFGSIILPLARPIVEEPITLKILMRGSSIVEDFPTNSFTQWYSERTGINLDFDVAPASEAQAVLNPTIASGDLPDIIVGFTVDPSTLALFGPQGLFLPLSDLIEEQGHFIYEVFETSPQVRPLITSPDGVDLWLAAGE